MVLIVNFDGKSQFVQRSAIEGYISQLHQLTEGAYITCEGKVIREFENLSDYAQLKVFLPLKGGKGGFGAKLKTEGGKKVRPNDNMYSRDIQGRPIAYAAVEKQYKQYYEKKLQEDESVRKQMAEFKVIQNTLKEEKAFMKLDRTYNAKMGEAQQRLSDALKFGLKNYLNKKKMQTNGEPNKEIDVKQKRDEQKQEIALQSKIVEENKQCQEQHKLNIRTRPLDEQKTEKQMPQKRIKLNEQTTVDKTSKPKMLSARDKLKSLFKK